MILALLLAASAPSALDAERAFAAAAKKDGQWTAFRRYATDNATMFVPQPINAQAFLQPLKDPPKSIDWWPTKSFVSCDGKLAANTGGWRRPDGSVGYFSTVWVRQADGGWKWIVDGGDGLASPRGQTKPNIERPACRNLPSTIAAGKRSATTERGYAPDGSVAWEWRVGADGARDFVVEFWDGKDYFPVIEDHIAAPPAPK